MNSLQNFHLFLLYSNIVLELHLFVEISMLICWKFLLTLILIIILSLLFPKGFSPGLPYQQEYSPRHLVLLITSFVMISVEQSILRLVCLSMIYRIIK